MTTKVLILSCLDKRTRVGFKASPEIVPLVGVRVADSHQVFMGGEQKTHQKDKDGRTSDCRVDLSPGKGGRREDRERKEQERKRKEKDTKTVY